MVKLLIVFATMAPVFAQGVGADPETSKLIEAGTNGGFFILAMYWMRQDASRANERLLELSKDAMARIEHAYAKRQPED